MIDVSMWRLERWSYLIPTVTHESCSIAPLIRTRCESNCGFVPKTRKTTVWRHSRQSQPWMWRENPFLGRRIVVIYNLYQLRVLCIGLLTLGSGAALVDAAFAQ